MNAATALEALAKLGIEASRVASALDAVTNRTVGWERAVVVDPTRGVVKGVLFDAGTTPASLLRPAALVGADTRDVLVDVGGYTSADVDSLPGVFVRPIQSEASGDTATPSFAA